MELGSSGSQKNSHGYAAECSSQVTIFNIQGVNGHPVMFLFVIASITYVMLDTILWKYREVLIDDLNAQRYVS